MLPCFRQLVRVSSSFLLLIVISAVQSGCLQEAPTPSVERGIAVLIALLQDESPEVRTTAAESMGKIGDRTALPAVLPLLHDPMPVVRATTAQALGRMASSADEAVIMELSRALEDPADTVRQAAALAIGDIEPSPRQLSTVADLLRSSDAHVRRAAVHALLALDTSQIASWLLPALDDPDAEVRQGAVAALGLSGDKRAEMALLKRLSQDPAPAVRAEAAYHLGELNGRDTATVLRAAVKKEPDPGVRRWMEAELKALRAND
jgi:HEAT repeat protein